MSSVTDQAELEMITEGKAAVFFPKGQVFYNRVQVSARMRRLLNTLGQHRRFARTGSESRPLGGKLARLHNVSHLRTSVLP